MPLKFNRIQQAKAMKEVFGHVLKNYTIIEIVMIWESYSEDCEGRGWADPSLHSIQEAFK